MKPVNDVESSADQPKYGRREFPVTIIVRAYGDPELTAKCLNSIVANTDPSLFHLVLVDQEDAVGKSGIETPVGMTWVVTPENMGAVRATNLGLQVAMLDPSELILVMDNDTRLPDGDKDWLNRWLRHFDDPTVGAAGATTDYASGLQNIAVTPRTYTKEIQNANEGGPAYTAPLETDYLISFACMYRKAALRSCVPPWMGTTEIGLLKQGRIRPSAKDAQDAYLWDEKNFTPGNSEDLDISIRISLAGYKLVVARDIYIEHVGSQAFKDMGFSELIKRNMQRLIDKWGTELLEERGMVRRVAG